MESLKWVETCGITALGALGQIPLTASSFGMPRSVFASTVYEVVYVLSGCEGGKQRNNLDRLLRQSCRCMADLIGFSTFYRGSPAIHSTGYVSSFGCGTGQVIAAGWDLHGV